MGSTRGSGRNLSQLKGVTGKKGSGLDLHNYLCIDAHFLVHRFGSAIGRPIFVFDTNVMKTEC